MEISSKNLTKLKKIEFDILVEFDKVCSKLKINYTLSAGTLLGAVRHQGFIPWDDDIDVAMLRKDYDKFMREGQKLLPKKLFLQNYETDKYYGNYFAKILNTQTTLIHKNFENSKRKNGAFIDIFPIDKISSNTFIRKIDNLLLYCINYFINCALIPKCSDSENIFYLLIKKIIVLPIGILVGNQRLCRLFTKILVKNNKINNSFTYADMVDRSEKKVKDSYIIPIKIYYNTKTLFFEQQNFKVIKDWNSYLIAAYGNYMELPPTNQRNSGHNWYKIKID